MRSVRAKQILRCLQHGGLLDREVGVVGGGGEGFLRELLRAIEANDRADDHVANLPLLSNASTRPCGDHQSGSNLPEKLTPHIEIRKPWTILRQVRLGLEAEHLLAVD